MIASFFCFAFHLTVLYGISIAVACLCALPIFYSFVITTSATALIFYFSTFFGMLFYAKLCMYACGFLSLLYFFLSCQKFCTLIRESAILFISLICISLLFANAYIVGADYTAFWAPFTKYIHTTFSYWDTIICGQQHSTYVPGFAILATMTNGLFEYLPESQYFSCVLPLLFLSCVVVQALPEYDHWSLTFLTVFFSLFAIKTLGCVNPINFLNVDYAIAAVFAAALLMAVLENNLRLSRIVLVVILPLLTLLKVTCLPMALVVTTLYGIRCYFEKKSLPFAIFQSAILLSTCLLVFVSWMISLDIKGLHDSSFVFSIEKIKIMITIYAENINNITHDLLDYIFFKPCLLFPKQISFFVSSFSLFVITIFLLMYHRRNSLQYSVYAFIIACSSLLWFLLHLYIIAIALPDASRVGIMSDTYPRYVGPFICALFLITFFSFLREHQFYKRIQLLYSKIASLLIILALPLFAYGVFVRAHPEYGNARFDVLRINSKFYEEYSQARRISDILLANTKDNSTIALYGLSYDKEVLRTFSLYIEPKRTILLRNPATDTSILNDAAYIFTPGNAPESYSETFASPYGKLYSKNP